MKIFGKLGRGVAAAVAAVVIGTLGMGYVNPALAAKLPLIGNIFEKVEDDAIYSGDYTDKKIVLTCGKFEYFRLYCIGSRYHTDSI